jgi:hypothetical protein
MENSTNLLPMKYSEDFSLESREQRSKLSSKEGKAVPLQAWSGPEGYRKLRFPD